MKALMISLALASVPVAGARGDCKQVKAETDVAGIRISDPASSERALGKRDAAGHPRLEDETGRGGEGPSFPFVRLATRDGREELKLFAHYGDIAGSYNEMEVALAPREGSRGRRLPVEAFMTERGVRLGMTEDALTALLGSCFERGQRHGETLIGYRIDDPNHPLLRRAGLPRYYARYHFQDRRLVRFRFGFDYP